MNKVRVKNKQLPGGGGGCPGVITNTPTPALDHQLLKRLNLDRTDPEEGKKKEKKRTLGISYW